LEFDMGIGLRLLNTENSDIPVIPGVGLGLFYRL